MTVLNNNMFGAAVIANTAAEGGDSAYEIEKSLRFNPSDSTYLSRTFSSAGSQRTWTLSYWVKKNKNGEWQWNFCQNSSGTDLIIGFRNDDTFGCQQDADSVGRKTTAQFRDLNAWYHFVIKCNTTSGVADERLQIYCNGVRVDDTNGSGTISQNHQFPFNTNVSHDIARYAATPTYSHVSLADVQFIDGLALSPAAFGSFDDSKCWNPKAFALPAPNDGRTWSSNTSNLTNPANAFDGSLSSKGTNSSTVTLTFNPALTNVTSFEHYTANSSAHLLGFNGGTALNDGGGAGWRKPPQAVPSTINSVEIAHVSGSSIELSGVRVDGQILIDGKTDPTTRNNVNNGTTWSSNGSVSGNSTQGGKEFSRLFDGRLDQYAEQSGNDVTLTWTPSATITVEKSMRIYFLVGGNPDDTVINGDATAINVDPQNGWTDVAVPSNGFTFSKLEMKRGGSGVYARASAIEIDGHILLDGADDNSCHLKFNDVTNNAALGTDSFSNGNWTVNNLQVADEAATSANFTGSLSSIRYRLQRSGGNSSAPELWAIKVNGTLITSGTGLTLTQSGSGGTSSNATNGDVTNYNRWWPSAAQDQWIQVAWDTAVNITSSVEFYCYGPGGDMTTSFSINGGAYRDFTVGNSAATWHTIQIDVAAKSGDSFVDSPTNYGTDEQAGGEVRGNYCTWNPLATSGPTFLNGNLDSTSASSSVVPSTGTFGMSSGKWYWEVIYTGGTDGVAVGVTKNVRAVTMPGTAGDSWAYMSYSGKKNHDGTQVAYGSAFTPTGGSGHGTTVGIALDVDNRKIWWRIDGTWQASGNPATGANAAYTDLDENVTYFPTCGVDSGGGNTASYSINAGQRAFEDAAPSGFKCLCTANLDDTFSGSELNNPSKYLDVTTFTGTGGTITRSPFSFQPDLVWFKGRSDSDDGHELYDVVRTATKGIYPHLPNAEGTEANGLTAFTANGFTTGDGGWVNTDGDTYVAWAWDAGTSASGANTDGSINIASGDQWKNTTAGFSITKYEGTGSAATIGHGLGAKPDLIICKNLARNDGYWFTYHSALGATKLMEFNSDAAVQTNSQWWNDTEPTASVFTVNVKADNNADNDNHVAYCWTAIPGYSAFGKYTGTGNADGPFIFTGMRPAYVLWKRTDGADNWSIIDKARSPNNVADDWLGSNSNSAESSNNAAYAIDMLSNGFKVRATHAATNASGGTYIYAAFAEHPFKTSRAR